MPHWTATIIVIAGEKLFSKRLWHRLRPPAYVVLDVHRGLRRQQQLGALHVAVACCKMQRSGTSAPQASEAPPAAAPRGFWASGPIYRISFQVINIRTAHYSHWFTGIQEESPLQMSKTRMNSKITCFNKMCCVETETCPKITALEFQGELWRREPEMRNPVKSHAHRSWKNLKFQILSHQKHATLNCNYLLWLPVKNCFQNGCDIGWGPRPLSSLTSTEAFAASSSLALST